MLIKSAENPSHFIIVAVLVIKRVQRVLPKLHANRAIIRTLTVTYGTLQKNKRSSVLNLPKQRQVCPSLFFQFNMRISVIYGTLSVSCKRVVRVLSPLASNFCGGSHLSAFSSILFSIDHASTVETALCTSLVKPRGIVWAIVVSSTSRNRNLCTLC